MSWFSNLSLCKMKNSLSLTVQRASRMMRISTQSVSALLHTVWASSVLLDCSHSSPVNYNSAGLLVTLWSSKDNWTTEINSYMKGLFCWSKLVWWYFSTSDSCGRSGCTWRCWTTEVFVPMFYELIRWWCHLFKLMLWIQKSWSLFTYWKDTKLLWCNSAREGDRGRHSTCEMEGWTLNLAAILANLCWHFISLSGFSPHPTTLYRNDTITYCEWAWVGSVPAIIGTRSCYVTLNEKKKPFVIETDWIPIRFGIWVRSCFPLVILAISRGRRRWQCLWSSSLPILL